MLPHQVTKMLEIAEPVSTLQQWVVDDQAGAELVRAPHDVAKRPGDEHHQRHRRQEVGLDVVVVVTHRRVDVDDCSACTDVRRHAVMQHAEECRESLHGHY